MKDPFTIPPGTAGLVFDLDGTLIDTMPGHFKIWRQALAEYGGEITEAQFYGWAGVTTHQIVERLNAAHGWDLPVSEVVARKEALSVGHLDNVPLIIPVVEVARRYHGVLPMAIATGGTRKFADIAVASTGLDQYFQVVVTSNDVARGKPAPDVFLEAARRLGVDPVLCVAFEDADLGLQSAREAGMAAIDIRVALRELAAQKA